MTKEGSAGDIGPSTNPHAWISGLGAGNDEKGGFPVSEPGMTGGVPPSAP